MSRCTAQHTAQPEGSTAQPQVHQMHSTAPAQPSCLPCVCLGCMPALACVCLDSGLACLVCNACEFVRVQSALRLLLVNYSQSLLFLCFHLLAGCAILFVSARDTPASSV